MAHAFVHEVAPAYALSGTLLTCVGVTTEVTNAVCQSAQVTSPAAPKAQVTISAGVAIMMTSIPQMEGRLSAKTLAACVWATPGLLGQSLT